MGKIIQADTFHGQTMFLSWRGYHASTNNGVLYDNGWTTTSTYPYATITPPFKGCINKVNITNNPYSSYQSGPTGSSATVGIEVNGTVVHTETATYTAGTAGEVLSFDLGTNGSFNANDRVRIQFQANGLWRYFNTGIQLKELA
jgi:hypothetical protein